MKSIILLSTLLLTQQAFATCADDVARDMPQIVTTIKDAIANAKDNCPNPSDEGDDAKNPSSFDWVKTYTGGNTVTRQCTVTVHDTPLDYTDGDGAAKSATMPYEFAITESGKAELGIFIGKDENGRFPFTFKIYMGGNTSTPAVTCKGIIDETETTTFTNSLIECLSDFGTPVTYRKDKNGLSCPS